MVRWRGGNGAVRGAAFHELIGQKYFGQEFFASFGERWIPLMERGSVLVVLWLIVWWMYRRKIFLRI